MVFRLSPSSLSTVDLTSMTDPRQSINQSINDTKPYEQLNQRKDELEMCESELMAEEELGTTLPAAYDSGRVAQLRQRADELRTATEQLEQRLERVERGIPVWL
jgi:ubiquinone biosynthesis protein UbiJ